MDSIIPLGQKNNLAEYMILSGDDNRPPVLDKDLYDSWKSRMELYMQNREYGRMILESVENGLLFWPTIEENRVTRIKKYAELSAAEKIQADYDMKATNIILQGLLTDIYSLERECNLYDVFDKFTHIKEESLHKYYLRFTQLINDMNIYNMKMEQFQVNTKFLNSLPPEWSFAVPVFSSGDDLISCLNKGMAFLTTVASLRVMLLVLEETMQADRQGLLNATTIKVKDIWLGNALNLSDQGMQHEELDTYDSDCDDVSNAKAVIMTNISNYGSDVISEDFEQTPAVDFTDNKIHSNSNIILYSQYLQETQLENVQDTNFQKLALKEQVDSLEQNISKQIKEKECLLQTFNVFKSESKEKEDKYMENEIDLEKKIKELDNILFKEGQCYQNPFYLKKAQRNKPTLYDGIVISDKHVAMFVIDDEETLILEEESRSKMFEKEKDPKAIKQNISHKPINYEKLNRLSNDFGKCFTPQQELSAEQDFWLRMSNPTNKSFDASPIKINAPKELPRKRNESCDKCSNIEVELLKSQNAHNDLFKSYSQLEKYCISLELSIQLNNEIFRKHDSCDNKNALEILEFFENNNLKAQLQDKDTTICKLKDIIKLMREKFKDKNVNYDYRKIETKNVELENSVAKLLLENERLCNEINHVKQVFKEQSDSIKKIRVRTKEQSDSLIDKLNLKSAENEYLKARIQDKELLVYVQDTCPNAIKLNAKKVAVTPKNNVKKVSPMRVASINGKRYILVIVDDYSRFTWVRFLRTKDEAPEAIIKCIKNIPVHLNATVRNTSVARTPQQNKVVKRRNRTLIEAARTMLIFSKAPLFLWAEAINTACYTQNRSLIRCRYNKTPYELMQDKKLDLSFFHVFGALCYPTNDNDDLGKLDAKVDIGIFVGYAPAKEAFRIYNNRTRKIIETIHVTFDELTAMASEQFSSRPRLHSMTPATSSS
ncbi:retrovirus-related pol polyprotein from transposon TNT 1-94 [Tanacetum coccineum]